MGSSKIYRLAQELLSINEERQLVPNCREKFFHIAGIIYHGKLISIGLNSYERICVNGHCVYSLHAEIDCLMIGKPNKWSEYKRKLSLIVIRSKNGELKESKPCPHCMETIIKIPTIKDLYHSTAEGTIAKIRL